MGRNRLRAASGRAFVFVAIALGSAVAGAQTLLPQAKPSVGCSTCFPKPDGIEDAFDGADLERILAEARALVIFAHDTELAHPSYEQVASIEERFPVFGSLLRTSLSKTELRGALVGRASVGPSSGPVRVYAAGTPIEQRKVAGLLRKLPGIKASEPAALFLSQEEDVEQARKDAQALIVAFHAPALAGFSRLALDGRQVEDEDPEGEYVLRSTVRVYRKRTREAAKAFDSVVGMLDKR